MRILTLALLIALLAPAVRAQPDYEPAVTAALDRAIALSQDGDLDPLAGHLACYTGGPDAAYLRPCLFSVDSARVAGVAAHFVEAYGSGAPWVLDWLYAEDPDGMRAVRTQVKIRSADPSVQVEYRFLVHADSLLLADAGAETLRPPEWPTPASPEEALQQQMQRLFRLATSADPSGASALIACPDSVERTIRLCEASDPADQARVEGFLSQMRAFLGRVGETGWGFTGTRSKDEQEGTWHVLEIGYLDASAPDGQAKAFAAFLEVEGGFALGDLAEWPE